MEKQRILLGVLIVVSVVLSSSINLTYAQVINVEFTESTKFIKGEFVAPIITGVDFDSKSFATGVILNSTGAQIHSFTFEILRWTDIGDRGQAIIQTTGNEFQAGILYTVIATYQEQTHQTQFTLSAPPLTVEESMTIIQTQQTATTSELEVLRAENAELRQQIIDLTTRIDGLILVIQEQIKVMMADIAALKL